MQVPAPFEYQRATSVADAIGLLDRLGDTARIVAGGHSLLMSGSPGSGKSMLAQRFAGLLPEMRLDEALEAAAISSLAGSFTLAQWAQRPTRQPHHTASAVALVGGGCQVIKLVRRFRIR